MTSTNTHAAQHTPEDYWAAIAWEVRRGERATSVYPVGGRERVADVYCPLDIEAGSIAEIAHLIASAPKLAADNAALLAALSDLMIHHSGMTLCGDPESECQQMLNARAAIDQARGDA